MPPGHGASSRCLRHLAEGDLDAVLDEAKARGVLDASAVVFDKVLLERVLSRVAASADTQSIAIHVYFDHARFDDFTDFRDWEFLRRASFADASWQRGADFTNARFLQSASFRGANFARGVLFRSARFVGEAVFLDIVTELDRGFPGDWTPITVLAEGGASFDDVTFCDSVTFAGSRFGAWTSFDRATFGRNASFARTSFNALASFSRARFEGEADFYHASSTGSIHFDFVTVTGRLMLTESHLGEVKINGSVADLSFIGGRYRKLHLGSEVVVRGRLGSVEATEFILNAATFPNRPRLEIAADAVAIAQTNFLSGSDLFVRGGDLVLNDVEFSRPSLLTCRALEDARRQPRPRLQSLTATDVVNLTLSGIDLTSCRFAGAYHLDQLVIGDDCVFPKSPRGWRWTDRQVIAEEVEWRQAHGGSAARAAWRGVASPTPEWLTSAPPFVRKPIEMEATAVAQVYRALRKALEERKDEPGAADFYYGEMEMRRLAAPRWSSERMLMSLYWAVSGYALRATRPLVALVIVLVAASLVFSSIGFRHDVSIGDALLFSLGTSVRLAAGPSDEGLTRSGEIVHILLGLIGPALYGLSVLSLRGRVKR